MSNFAKAMNACAQTWNGAQSYSNPDITGKYTGRISLFFKGVRGLQTTELYKHLERSSQESLIDTFVLVFQLRDCREGKGERQLGRDALAWLMTNFPDEFAKILHLLPEYGRWDDLLHLFPGVFVPEKNVNQVKELQESAVKLFAKQLRKDLHAMNEGKPVSLCAKWSPSESCSLNKKYKVYNTLCKTMNIKPRSLRVVYNTPLREYIKVVETFICSGRWNEIDYSKVPSQCMKRLRKSFEKNDSERFNEWKQALEKKDNKDEKVKVNAGAIHPHELINEVRNGKSDTVIEEQWKVIEEKVKNSGVFDRCLPIVDSSGSMMGYGPSAPINVAVAMGLLIANATQGDFHNHCINFSEQPVFTVIPDANLSTRYNSLVNMQWNMTTNFTAVFKMILNRALKCKLTQEDMPKTLFVISDMQFDSAGGNRTNMEAVNEMYTRFGYIRPNIVFWNVNGSPSDFPTTTDENGTAMISGFSPSILKAVLEGGEDISTVSILRRTLDGKRYRTVRTCLGEEEDFEII